MNTSDKFEPSLRSAAPHLYGASALATTLPTASLVKDQQPPAPATTVIAKVITGDNRMDPLIDDASYRFNDGSPVATAVTVTFSFPTVMPSTYTGEDALDWKPFSAVQQAATREILALLQQQTKITFQEVTESATLSGTMRFCNNTQTTSAGYALLPNSTKTDRDADTWMASGANTPVVIGDYTWQTLVHEIGHAVGLNHPGNYNAGESKNADAVGNFLSANEDAFFNSIMSYRQSAQDINAIWFMPYDMLTLRYLYGKSDYGMGDTAYTYTDAVGTYVTNIVDDGGVDTLNFSAVTAGVVLNLTPGAYSSVGKLASGANALANLTTALDATIEKAIGTAVADTMLGNAANNSFTGGGGDDALDGAAGADTAVYSGARASYTVTRGAGNITVTGGAGTEGTDTLTNIERLQFSDTKLGLDSAAGEVSGNAYLLCGAVLGSTLLTVKKDVIGAVVDLMDQGFSFQVLSGAVMRLTSVWDILAGGHSSTQIATYLLNTVNKAPFDQATLDGAVAALNSETGAAQGTFLYNLAASAANQTQVNLVGVAATGIEFGP
jgi:hypothetical protein